MPRPRARDLTGRELEVMHVFWKIATDATAQEVRDRMAEAGTELTYTTVATLVRILHEKGFLAQINQARPFRYRAIRSFEDVSGRFIGELIDRVFRGSREQLFMRLFEHQKLTDAERALLNDVLKEQQA
jgi:predicted transcriptional regulator